MMRLALLLLLTIPACAHHCKPVVVVAPCAGRADRNPYNPPLVIHKSTLSLSPGIEWAIDRAEGKINAILGPRSYSIDNALLLGVTTPVWSGEYDHVVDSTPQVSHP